MSAPSRVVIVGASLAGLRAAEELVTSAWPGTITLVGDESDPPYDRPPLSNGVLTGRSAAAAPSLALRGAPGVEWRLGATATGLDRAGSRIRLADGRTIGYDHLIIATGRRARPWSNQAEARLDGVITLRSIDDALDLRRRLATRPRRVVVIGAGFIGCEVSSAARSLGIDVTLVARGRTPLDGAVGQTVGAFVTDLVERNGVDLRTSTTAARILDGGDGRVRGVLLADGSSLDADVVVVATGSLPNVEWLGGSGLDIEGGVAVDERQRALDCDGRPSADVFAAGDVTRWEHPLFGAGTRAVEHWSNAVEQGRTAARAIAGTNAAGSARRTAADGLPQFWSTMFGTNIKAVGVPSLADEVVLAQGSLDERRGVVLYGSAGRIVAAVGVDAPRELDFFASLVASGAAFPPNLVVADWKGGPPPLPVGAGFR